MEDFNHQQVTENCPSSSSTPAVPLHQAIPQAHPDLNLNRRIPPPQQCQEHEVPLGPTSITPTNPTHNPVNNPINVPPLRRSGRPSNPPARLIYGEFGNPENG